MTIYTGGGDAGETSLFGGDRVSKAHPRIESYGTVDELNALVGTIRPSGYPDVDEQLAAIQNHLHVIQAELANPTTDDDNPHITADIVNKLEDWIDSAQEELDPLQSFILPGGSPIGARLHHARTVCRRAERRVVGLDSHETVNVHLTVYLNRLSDLFFVLARLVNAREGVAEEVPSY